MFSDDLNEDLEIITYIHDESIDASGGAKGYHDKNLILSALTERKTRLHRMKDAVLYGE